MTVPVNVCIKRYYRAYVQIPESANSDELVAKACEEILENQDEALINDPDLEIENDDIIYILPDWDGVQMD